MRNLLIFVVLGASWVALLWFGIAPDLSKWSIPTLLAIHTLPPVAASMTWWAGSMLVKRRKARQAEERKKQAEARRQAEREEARIRHERKLRELRFACDCKMLAIADLAVHEKCELPAGENVWIQTVPAAEKAFDPEQANILNVLEPAITQALRQVYQGFGAAAVFPIHIVPPSGIAAVDIHHRLRVIHAHLVAELDLPVKLKDGMPAILHLPAGGSAAGSVIGLFDSSPDLPGAVVLAFDSPLSQIAGAASPDNQQTSSAAPVGQSGHGVFALLMTHPDLAVMVEMVSGRHDEEGMPESVLPYWESIRPQGNPGLLTLAPPLLREALVRRQPVARIHRPAFARTGERSGHVLELERALITLLEQAQLHAGLRELRFANDGDVAQNASVPALPQAAPRCEWLIHNAGDLGRTGSRLAAIANALMHFRIEVKPVEKGIGMTRQFGDLGCATRIGMLALTLAQARAMAAPALCAEFSEPDGVAVAFAVPAQTA